MYTNKNFILFIQFFFYAYVYIYIFLMYSINFFFLSLVTLGWGVALTQGLAGLTPGPARHDSYQGLSQFIRTYNQRY